MTIRIGNSEGSGEDLTKKSPEGFCNQYGELLKTLAIENDYDVALVASVLYHESDGGTGFVDGKLFIRFEVHHFLSIDGGGTPGNSSQYANSSFYQKYFDLNTSSLWLGHKWRNTDNGEYTIVHPTGTKKDNNLQWQVFEFARSLNPNAAYNALGMGIPQIQGFNHNAIGFNSAEEMFRSFESGNEAQIRAFFKFSSSNNKLSNAFKSNTQDNLTTIATIYNGGGNNANYIGKISELYPLFESLK